MAIGIASTLLLGLFIFLTVGLTTSVEAARNFELNACIDKKTMQVRITIAQLKCRKSERTVPLNTVTTQPTAAIRYGVGAPNPSLGYDGDFYVDTATYLFYGPRTVGNWGVGQSLIGPTGAQGLSGSAGPTGPAGPAGPAGLNGAAGGFGDYGSFIDTEVRLLTQNTPYAIPLNVTQFAQGVSVVSDTQITMSGAGKYNIAFSLQLFNSINTRPVVTIWLNKNDSPVTASAGDIYLGTSADTERSVAAWNFFVDAEPGDYFTLMIVTDGTGVSLFGGASANAGVPAIPSTILTVNQVG
jgi:hypothetical protein